MRSKKLAAAVILAAAAVLSACSAAPKPQQLVQGENLPSLEPGPDGVTPSAAPSSSASPKPGASASPGAPGTTTPTSGPSTPGGSASTPTDPGIPSSEGETFHLFPPATDTTGITGTSIKICAHAALTYGSAFGTNADDFNVYWSAANDAGGYYGRKVYVSYENDNYDPTTAVQAANTCNAKGIFFLLGGIGFDQIPAVRTWAESHKVPYFHHIAAEKTGLKYSWTASPSVEKFGKSFAELAGTRFKGKKVGILYRSSPEWDPGFQAFKKRAKELGVTITAAYPVQKNQATYTQQLVALRNSGAQVVWAWENALATTEMLLQAKQQGWKPQWMIFPFNLISQTLGANALDPPLVGISSWPAYSKQDYSGNFASYAPLMKKFEAQYAKYRPNAHLEGVSGDLLFLNWMGQEGIGELLNECGKDCTRNRFFGLFDSGLKKTFPGGCVLDFSKGDRHHGNDQINIVETYKSPSGKVNFRPIKTCLNSIS